MRQKIHRVLLRQLRKAGIDDSGGATREQLASLLLHVDRSYHGADRERYLLERSLQLTSREMQELYDAQQQASETAIAAERDKLRAVLESLGDGLIILDEAACITLLNPEAERIFGRDMADCHGLPVSALGRFETGSGSTLDIEDLAEGTFEVRENDGRLVTDDRQIAVAFVLNPIVQAEDIIGAVLVFRDITAPKAAERREKVLQQTLARRARLESVGLLAGGVAHDLNNILGPMVAYPPMILEQLPEDSPIVEDVEAIEESARRAAAVIQDLLTLARRGAYATEAVAINRVVRSLLRGVALQKLKTTRPDVAIHCDLGASLPTIESSSGRLNQVLLNLVINAVEAIPDGGSVTIITRFESLTRERQGYEVITPGEYVVLEVRDTGTGISPQDLQHIFEPFYTKKKMGRSGSGLGLAVVYGVVRDAGGGLVTTSAPGQGSTFELYLPAAAMEVQAPPVTRPRATGSETILLVDDVPEQRRLGVRILKSLGYQAHAAENGRAAVVWLQENHADLAVLDMIMEDDFDGLDTWVAISKLRPELRCVIASGFSETERVRQAQRLGAGPLVEKPYTREAIATAVRAELDRQQ